MAIPFHRTKLLVVDMDNTLCDTFNTLSKKQWNIVAKKLKQKGCDICFQTLEDDFGKHGFKYALQQSGMSVELMEYAIRQYDKVDVKPLKLFSDARSILRLDMPKMLISRGERTLQMKKIKHLKIAKHFDKIFIVDTFSTKREVLANVLKQNDLKPKEVLIIGDRIEEEIADGKVLGIPTVLVRRPGWPIAKSRYKPDLTVRSLETVAKKLGRR